jgi:hypothetical protein
MSILRSDSFTRIHDRWLEPIENPGKLDEYLEAEQEKQGILHAASQILSNLPGEDIQGLDGLNEAVLLIEKDLHLLKELNNELKRLEEITQHKDPSWGFN